MIHHSNTNHDYFKSICRYEDSCQPAHSAIFLHKALELGH
jgi:hypothetical protein